MIDHVLGRLHDTLMRHRRTVAAAAVGVFLVAASGMPGQDMDMSFRPFFLDAGEELDATREFVEAFGPIDATHVGVILQSDRILSRDFLTRLRQLSDDVGRIPQVIEVVSLTHLHAPVWTESGVDVQPVLPEAAYAGDVGDPEALSLVPEHPAVRRIVLSPDGRMTLLLARLDGSLRDLDARQPVVDAFRSSVEAAPLGETRRLYVGAPVVEASYADIVERSLTMSMLLNTICLVSVLLILFRRVSGVVISLMGAFIATPMTLGLMSYAGQSITITNSMVPTMVLIIGVADAIHMLRCFYRHRTDGEDVPRATRKMFVEMGMPCFLTTVTTALGFLSLQMAEMAAIRDFGLNVAMGVVLVYGVNLVAIPLLLSTLPEQWLTAPRRGGAGMDALIDRITRRVIAAPGRVVIVGALLVVAGVGFIPRLVVDQRFNEDVDAGHPVREGQELLEREFSGFLGPTVSLRRVDRGSLLTPAVGSRVRAYQAEVAALPEVLGVRSHFDYVPPEMPEDQTLEALDLLRADARLGVQVRELVDAAGSWAGIQVRTEDMGTRRAEQFQQRMESIAVEHLGSGFEVQLVGQWWLAQGGMRGILRDMIVSFATSCVLVLIILALVVRTWRLFLVSVIPNVLPMVLALGFMAMTGITVRIGTAMVLAIALGIAIDDTLHFIVGMREETRRGSGPEDAVRVTMRRAGGSIVYSTVVLGLGFLSMLSNDLLAIRDMGLVAAVTLAVALAADVVLAPALYLLIVGKGKGKGKGKR